VKSSPEGPEEAPSSDDVVEVLKSLLGQCKPYVVRADREGPNAHPRLLLNQINAALEHPAFRSSAAPAALVEVPGARKPDGCAYRYHNYSGGTEIRFNHGAPVNGSDPIESIPYWLGTPGASAAARVTEGSPLTIPGLDALIAEADKYILPVDVKIGAATFRKGVKVGTMLRGLKTHAERQNAESSPVKPWPWPMCPGCGNELNACVCSPEEPSESPAGQAATPPTESYCICGRSELGRAQHGYYCKTCGKDLHPDNYEATPPPAPAAEARPKHRESPRPTLPHGADQL